MIARVLRGRRARLIALLTLLAVGASSVAFGFLTATSRPGASDPVAKARTLAATSAPTATLAGTTATIAIQQTSPGAGSTLLGAMPGGRYVVRRYPSTAGAPGSAGTVVTCSVVGAASANPYQCSESSVPAGSWKYTAAPRLNNFEGSESPFSGVVTVPAGDTAAPAPTIAAPTNGSGSAVIDENVSYYTVAQPSFEGTGGRSSGDDATVSLRTRPRGSNTWSDPVSASVGSGNGRWSAAVPADLAHGEYVAQVTQRDAAGNEGTATLDFAVYRTATSATEVRGVNSSTGEAGRVNAGDAIEFTFGQTMRRSSVSSAWSNSATAATSAAARVEFTADRILLKESTGNNELALKQLTHTSGHYVTAPVTFSATLTRTGSTVRVTLNAITSGTASSIAPATTSARTLTWSSNAMIDAAGRSLAAGSRPSTSAVQF